jgi:NAD(P)-dependent dehydrogenase (short-subunit alcohol dehydrogenase family)
LEDNRKYALITGASSGTGWHFPEVLAKNGCSLVTASNQPEQRIVLLLIIPHFQ